MQIDLRTVTIRPQRQTFTHVAKRLGADKPASRYQEGTWDVQAVANFHYRPLWDAEHEIFDPRRTAIVMQDWYAFKDPRQFYYGTYTLARAKQQDAAEAAFEFVEDRQLISHLPENLIEQVLAILLPLRHAEWGANMNNSFICAYGYGTAITQPAMYHAMDRLGIAQYLTRIGLTIAEPDCLDHAKTAWLEAPMWQGLRRYIEDTLVLKDWFELFIAQNVVLDGLLYPLIYEAFDDVLTIQGGASVSMLTQFMRDWYEESVRWVDASAKTAAAESTANQAQLSSWVNHWQARAIAAIEPLAATALPATANRVMDDVVSEFNTRLNKLGIHR